MPDPSNSIPTLTVPALIPCKRLLALGLAAATMWVSGPAAAQEYCSEPVQPYCVSTDSDFETLLQVNRCEDDLTDYEEELKAYEQCIEAQTEKMRQDLSDARRKLEETKQDF